MATLSTPSDVKASLAVSHGRPYGEWLAALLLAMPWLPFWTWWGPSASALQLLFTWGLVGALLALWRLGSASWAPLGTGWIPGYWRSAALAWAVGAALNAMLCLLQFAGWEQAVGGWSSEFRSNRVFGALRQPNQFATLMNLGLAVALVCATSNSCLRTLPIAFGVVLASGANALSSSRTGAVGLLMTCAMFWWWSRLRVPAIRLYLALAAGTYGVVTGAVYMLGRMHGGPRGVLGRLTDGSSDCHSRLTLWHNVLDLIAQRPWSGWGWGELDYAHFATVFEGPRFCALLDNAHNLPLHLAVELGVPLALALMGAMIFLVIRAQPWREREPARQMAWMVLALVMLHSLVEYPLWYAPFQLAMGLAVGILAARPVLAFVRPPAWRVHAQRLLGVVLVFASAYAAWDYWRVSQIYRPKELRAAAYREDTLNKISSSWLFADQVRFARLTITPLTLANAEPMHELAERMLHFSPEPAVIEKYIASAKLLGRETDAAWVESRYAAAFPDDHARWKKTLSAAR